MVLIDHVRRLLLSGLLILLLASLAAVAEAQQIFPPLSAVGLVPPPGYAIADEFSGFAAQDGSAVITISEAPPSQTGLTRTQTASQLATIGSRRLDAMGFQEVRRGPFGTEAFTGTLFVGTVGTGSDLETAWVLYFAGTNAIGSVAWRIAGTPTAEQSAAMERALASVVTRPPATPEERLAALPFGFDTSVFDLSRTLDGSVILASLHHDDQMLLALVAPPDPPLADRIEAARRLFDHPRILALVRTPNWDGAGTPAEIGRARYPGVALRARVTHTPTNREIKVVLRVAFLPDGRMLVALACPQARNAPQSIESERRFAQVTDSLFMR